jgi:chemotaxis methyl-accepting protein methylase
VTDEESAYGALFERLERERGFRGNLYRQKCLRRRVAVRMRARGATDVGHYTALLDADPAEYDHLLRTLTINVSKFFRNPETWQVISRQVLPDLLSRPSLMLWSAGTATGEEAYTLAMMVTERLGETQLSQRRKVRIVGTDIDGPSLEVARRGVYPDLALAELPANTRARWFEPHQGWRLKAALRSRVEFERHDVLVGRPDFDADLIVCRNLLIYLDRPAQDRVVDTFVQVLKPASYLVLGRAETLAADARRLFRTIDARERVYQKIG